MGVSGSQENIEKKPVVVIAGAGYAGVHCAQALDKTGQFFIVLIDRKSYFLHSIGALRASVEENFIRRILIPYDRLLTNGCFVKAEVTSISHDGVYVHGRDEPIIFDYLIIATGSSYAFPGKLAETEMRLATKLYSSLQEKIKNSQQILIAGGGPVGIELAGEIATDYPNKQVTLVHNQPTLLQPGIFTEKFYRKLQEQLEHLHVRVILNDRVRLTQADESLNYVEGRATYITENNKISIVADLAFLCTGAHVNNKSIQNGSLKSKLNPETGRIIVNNYLQVDGYENIFAIGDISDKESKQAYLAEEQAQYIAKIIPLLYKKKRPKEYSGRPYPGLLLSVGRNGGMGQLPFRGGITLGSFLMKQIKSKDLFSSNIRSLLKYNTDDPKLNRAEYVNKLDSLQSSLSVSQEDAEKLMAGLPEKELDSGQYFS